MGHAVHPPKPPIIVARPRACDAVGASLRDAFARDGSVPDDMSGLLRRLCNTGTVHHR